MSQPVKIGLLGLGTVGTGVVHLLTAQADRLTTRAGRPIQIERVVVRDPERGRLCDVPRSRIVTNVDAVLEDPQIEIVVELVGGVEPAGSWVAAALQAGKDVVTANKALLAERGHLLFPLARRLGRVIACEGSVAGGLPILATVRQSLTAFEIRSICAILNGTSNYILDRWGTGTLDFAQSLGQAQALGFAESDPTLDIDGTDAAQKLAILAQLAFGFEIDWRDIPRRGIDGIGEDDFARAIQSGHRIRPLACALQGPPDSGELDLFVAPAMVPEGSPLYFTAGVDNAVLIQTAGMGCLLFQGTGAGQLPTASAVVGDLVDVVVGRTRIADQHWPLWPASLPRWRPAINRSPLAKVVPYPAANADAAR